MRWRWGKQQKFLWIWKNCLNPNIQIQYSHLLTNLLHLILSNLTVHHMCSTEECAELFKRSLLDFLKQTCLWFTHLNNAAEARLKIFSDYYFFKESLEWDKEESI